MNMNDELKSQLKTFSHIQVKTAFAILKGWEDPPVIHSGKNEELILTWKDGDIQVSFEISTSGAVFKSKKTLSKSTFEGES